MLHPRIHPSLRLLAGFCLFVLTASAWQGRSISWAEGFISRNEVAGFQLRVMCWNVKVNSIFSPDGKRAESYRRIVAAVGPDVVCLQEVYGRSEEEIVRLMDECLPLDEGRSWQVHTATDNVVLSRFPLRHRERELPVPFPLPGLPEFHYGQAMCLVDIPRDQCDKDFYVVAMHNRSRGGEANVRMRQRQSDSIARWLRELRRRNDEPLAHGTPLIILGDMNVLAVEPADPTQHLLTLLTGNIVDEESFGADWVPDWDGTNLVEVKPRHNARGKEFYTWREDATPFPPGALDRIIYSDSVLSVENAFVLNTTTMTRQELESSGLTAPDVLWEGQEGNYDHLPLVADFSLRRRAE